MKSAARDGGLPNAARYADAGRTLKKRRPREGAVKSDVPVVLLLVENAHRRIEDRGVVQRHDSAVGTLFHMDADISFGIVMLPAEIVADGVHVDSQFVRYPLRAAAGQFILDTAQLIKCDNHSFISFRVDISPTKLRY